MPRSNSKINNNASGRLAEFLARWLLRLKGYRIIAANHKTQRGTGVGEIDLIARKGKTLAFVEVKKRADLDAAAYAISATQKKRIIKGAELFLKQNPGYAGADIRFDAVLVKLPLCLKHIKNAWLN